LLNLFVSESDYTDPTANTIMPTTELFDDKSPIVLPFVLDHLSAHEKANTKTPFFIGLNGVQGAGKTVLVSSLARTFSAPPYNRPTCVFSLDDLYLTHADQVELANSNPDNPLLQHRGQPGTHDIELALEIFQKLKANEKVRIPKYNKALYNGQGDRQPEEEWDEVNSDPSKPIKVVIFEGWCVGFQPLTSTELQAKHDAAVKARDTDNAAYQGRLGHNTLESVTAINESGKQYSKLWEYFNVFVHIDAADPLYVYKWRLEQEATTKREKGGGMSDEEIQKFVDGYYPSYELYSDTLRDGVFKPRGDVEQDTRWKRRQLRMVVGEDRKVREVHSI
jgi:D-glycerate 3-kinase